MPAPERAGPIPAIEILVEAGAWPPDATLRPLLERALGAAIDGARLRLMPAAELSLVFTDDTHGATLNHRYRGKQGATNVLSFPAPQVTPNAFGPLLGDIVFAAGVIAREAAEADVPFDQYLTHLVVHGFLHLVGYDHGDDKEAAVMEKLETAILARLGVADPYGGRAE